MFFLLTENMSKIINSSMYKDYMNFVSVPFNFAQKYNIFNYKKVLNEKNRLEKKVLSLEVDDNKSKSLQEDNDKLKKLLDIDKLYTDYDVVYAKTIIRNKMYWYSRITIDKGSDENIKVGDAVISVYGLIGSVESVTENSSVVKLITNNDKFDKISVGINTSSGYKNGLIKNYQYPYLEVELVESVKGISVGDKLITSGLGSFPKNISIGEVYDLKKDRYGLVNILYVKPFQDMNDINYVGVLKK